jgi:hypothetical protein
MHAAGKTNSNREKVDEANLSRNKGKCSRKRRIYTDLQIVLTSRDNAA